MRECNHCGKVLREAVGQRRFCNGSCKQAYHLAKRKAQTVTNVTDQTVTEGVTATLDKRSSILGDPQGTESRESQETVVVDFPHKVVDPRPVEQQPPYQVDSSKCFKDSGIPLPGDPGYKGCLVRIVGNGWTQDPDRKQMTQAEQKMRYARC